VARDDAYPEEEIGRLLGMLSPAPAAWVQAAKELPAMRRSLDELVARAEADEAFRAALAADLEATLARSRVVVEPGLLEELRRRYPSA
jgi:hypothetical protein